MRIVDKAPSPEVQDVVDRMNEIINEGGVGGIMERMASDHTPDVRCFMAASLREIGESLAVTFMFERR